MITRRFAFAMMALGGFFMAAPVVRFRIDFADHTSVGPGKIRLLEAIRDAGSLSQGARDIGMSYRRAWLLVESLKKSFREPVTVASTGGKRGGGMLITEFGEALIKNYRDLEQDFAKLAERRLQPIIGTVMPRSKSKPRSEARETLNKFR
jgi:molybdate transport system regulatory protein